MLVIHKNAETHFLEELKIHSKDSPSMRCLLFRSSKTNTVIEKWLDSFVRNLTNLLQDDNVSIYVCQDQDILVFSRILTNKIITQLLAHLTPKLGPAPTEELAAIFEVGVQGNVLQQIAKRKLENIEILRQKAKMDKEKALEKISRQKMIKNLDPDLIHTIASRREKREQIEIMIVEDDPFSQKLVCNALDKEFKTCGVPDGKGALMTYITKAPDVLFLDIGLPDMDGHSVLEEIFEIDPLAYVVMLSGNGDRENIIKAIERGAKGFIGKPFTKEKLFQYIDKSPFILTKRKKQNSLQTA